MSGEKWQMFHHKFGTLPITDLNALIMVIFFFKRAPPSSTLNSPVNHVLQPLLSPGHRVSEPLKNKISAISPRHCKYLTGFGRPWVVVEVGGPSKGLRSRPHRLFPSGQYGEAAWERCCTPHSHHIRGSPVCRARCGVARGTPNLGLVLISAASVSS